MTKMFLLMLSAAVLTAALFSNCVNLPAPPLQFTMYCDTCGHVTSWLDDYPYFECSASGTRW